MRTGNPALNAKTFANAGDLTGTSEVMTIQGTVNKTVLLLLFVMVSSSWIWNRYSDPENISSVYPWLIGGGIGGFIVAIITAFKKTWK